MLSYCGVKRLTASATQVRVQYERWRTWNPEPNPFWDRAGLRGAAEDKWGVEAEGLGPTDESIITEGGP